MGLPRRDGGVFSFVSGQWYLKCHIHQRHATPDEVWRRIDLRVECAALSLFCLTALLPEQRELADGFQKCISSASHFLLIQRLLYVFIVTPVTIATRTWLVPWYLSFSVLAVHVGIQLLGTESFKIVSALKVVVALMLLLKLWQASRTSMTTNSDLMWPSETSSRATTSLPDMACYYRTWNYTDCFFQGKKGFFNFWLHL